MDNSFPEITIQGNKIDAKKYIKLGTSGAVFAAFLVAIIITLLAILLTYGIFLIILLFYPLYTRHLHKKSMALIHGSGIHVNENQFPEIYQCLLNLKERLNLKKDIDIYIVEDNVMNAFAVKYGKKNVVLLTDDIIHGCMASGCPQALTFVIAHELAHIVLNHTGVFHSWISQQMKILRRLDEYSADAVATALVNDKTIALRGLLLLTVGYAMMPYVNIESLVKQAQEVEKDKYSKKAERSLTHPLLLNRLQRVMNTR